MMMRHNFDLALETLKTGLSGSRNLSGKNRVRLGNHLLQHDHFSADRFLIRTSPFEFNLELSVPDPSFDFLSRLLEVVYKKMYGDYFDATGAEITLFRLLAEELCKRIEHFSAEDFFRTDLSILDSGFIAGYMESPFLLSFDLLQVIQKKRRVLLQQGKNTLFTESVAG